LATFLVAAGEALDLLDTSLAKATEPEPTFSGLAAYERDLAKVRGAFDVAATDPDVLRGEHADDEQIECAELVFGSLLDVRGEQDSSVTWVDVGRNGSLAGTLTIRPVPVTTAEFDLDVQIDGTIVDEPVLREIKEAIDNADVLTIYYQSGHAFAGRHIKREKLDTVPFRDIEFADFTGFEISREKPEVRSGQSLHDAIGAKGDKSLFAWVVRRFSDGWLLCDDGPGEAADFLHIDDDRTLQVIHVKAGSHASNRGISVTRFEQVVSQAEKNVVFLHNDALIAHLDGKRTAHSAAWHNGSRVAPVEFIEKLRTRLRSDKTYVVILQPHLSRAVYERARTAANDGKPSRDSYSLTLLDMLLHSTRRTITGRCDDLRVIGAD
jgi:hypothetical protein